MTICLRTFTCMRRACGDVLKLWWSVCSQAYKRKRFRITSLRLFRICPSISRTSWLPITPGNNTSSEHLQKEQIIIWTFDFQRSRFCVSHKENHEDFNKSIVSISIFTFFLYYTLYYTILYSNSDRIGWSQGRSIQIVCNKLLPERVFCFLKTQYNFDIDFFSWWTFL